MSGPEGWVQPRDRAVAERIGHPVRAGLLQLLARVGTVTATEAARELGGNSGSHSFHLRQLARFGLVEEAPGRTGRARPWRLVTPAGTAGRDTPGSVVDGAEGEGPAAEEMLARGLEDESYRRWVGARERAPDRWRQDEAFSQVVYLTPAELQQVGAVIRREIARYRSREESPAHRPPGAAPVAVVARIFPLLSPEDADR